MFHIAFVWKTLPSFSFNELLSGGQSHVRLLDLASNFYLIRKHSYMDCVNTTLSLPSYQPVHISRLT